MDQADPPRLQRADRNGSGPDAATGRESQLPRQALSPSSSTLALSADADHLRLAGLLRRAHKIALDTGVAPRAVRPVISDSWQRSVASGVDPGRPAPRVLDARRTAAR